MNLMKRSLLNVLSGFATQIVTMIIGFIIPRLFLLQYGSEVNGLISSTNQLLSYLVLFEAGVGSATIQALFGFVGRQDYAGINGVMSATNKYYKKTGWFYLSGTIVLALIYPLLLNTSIPYSTVFSIIACAGFAGAISFFTYSKYTLLLNAENKIYIINSVTMLTLVTSGLIKVYLIGQSVNVVVLQIAAILFAIFQFVLYRRLMKTSHAWLDLSVIPDYKSISQKSAALLHQIASLVSSNTDMLLITFFIGLKSVSIYGLYNLVFSSVGTLISNLYSGIRSKLGQIYNSDLERYKSLFHVFEILYTAVACSAIMTSYVMIIPFIKLYTAGVHDINYLDTSLPLLFTLIQLLVVLRLPIFDTVYFAGYIKATQWHTVGEALVNLGISIVLVKPMGINGVLIGTAVALVFRTFVMIFFVQKRVKAIDLRKSLMVQLLNIVIFIAGALLSRRMTYDFNSFPILMLGIVLCLILTTMIFLTINVALFRRTFKEYRNNTRIGHS